MRKLLICLYFILFIIPAFSQPEYFPKSNNDVIINHTFYMLSYSEQNEQAIWVAYELTKKEAAGGVERADNFRPDPLVTTSSAQLSDYTGSGYDRGHLAPAGDMAFSEESMSNSFYMSNMSPQDPGFNRGIWKTLESQVRNWASSDGPIFVVTGPIFRGNLGKIGANEVTVPGYYYKALMKGYPDSIQMIAFVLPNRSSSNPLSSFVVTIDSLELLTQIDFFPGLPDNIESSTESKVNFSVWGLGSGSVAGSPQSVAPVNKTTGGTTVQCNGIAKSSGQRCRNKTSNANGYCYQHQSQSPGALEPTSKPAKTSTKPAATGTSSGGRCIATTKAGTRCKRAATPGSSYCWQHQR